MLQCNSECVAISCSGQVEDAHERVEGDALP